MSARFLEIAITTDDVLQSLQFYRSLGFTELPVNDAWQYPYAVVSDGQVALGLHGLEKSSPLVTLTMPDVAPVALKLAESEFLDSMHISEDDFDSVKLVDQDGHGLRIVEARTFSPGEVPEVSKLGHLLEFTMPVRDAVQAAQFWAPWSPRSLAMDDATPMHMRFDLAGLPIGLSERCRGRDAVLCYCTTDLASIGVALDRLGTPLQACSTALPGCLGTLRSPGGLTIALFPQDFLPGNA
ncbi:MAG: hypothetical protein AAFO81_09395 [Pseudomonadota bacterium]